MSDTLAKVECKLQILNTRLGVLKGFVKSCESIIVEEHRKKWWLLNPEVAIIRYIAMWETNYAHSEWDTYPIICWQSIIDVNGKELPFDTQLDSCYPALESEITDEETVLVVRNPYLCT